VAEAGPPGARVHGQHSPDPKVPWRAQWEPTLAEGAAGGVRPEGPAHLYSSAKQRLSLTALSKKIIKFGTPATGDPNGCTQNGPSSAHAGQGRRVARAAVVSWVGLRVEADMEHMTTPRPPQAHPTNKPQAQGVFWGCPHWRPWRRRRPASSGRQREPRGRSRASPAWTPSPGAKLSPTAKQGCAWRTSASG